MLPASIKRSLHRHSAVPMVCVQCSGHTHLVCDTPVATLRAAIALGANACVPLLCAASTCSSFQPFFRTPLSFFPNLHSTCRKEARRQTFTVLRSGFLIITSLHKQLNDTRSVCLAQSILPIYV